uniref:C-type lectin domain-containing protein n=1 Tax=Ascaris lumbricoides TaxID=6252 RepID=A0A9J2PCF7_ASCLU
MGVGFLLGGIVNEFITVILELYNMVAVSVSKKTQAVAASRCDPGWRYSPFTRKCYRFYDHDTMWPSAEFSCLFKGGHLISLHSNADNRFAIELARGAETVWLGNAQFGSSTEYIWSDHTTYNFENWPNRKRPDKIKNRPCTKLNTTSGEWFQSCCKEPSPYICEKEVSASNANYRNSEELLSHKTDDYRESDSGDFRKRFFL